jgi:hypothetical protein
MVLSVQARNSYSLSTNICVHRFNKIKCQLAWICKTCTVTLIIYSFTECLHFYILPHRKEQTWTRHVPTLKQLAVDYRRPSRKNNSWSVISAKVGICSKFQAKAHKTDWANQRASKQNGILKQSSVSERKENDIPNIDSNKFKGLKTILFWR